MEDSSIVPCTNFWATASIVFAVAALILPGCSSNESLDAAPSEAPPVMTADDSDEPTPITVRELRKLLKVNELAKFEKLGNDIVAAELYQSGVRDIAPLKGLPLRSLDLGFTNVTDISALEGMPLTYLNLEETKIEDLSPLADMKLEELHLHSCPLTNLDLLAGMPLQRLNLSKVPVVSIEACADMPLQTLWIPNTKVSDLSPLAGKKLQSLDAEGTEVADLSPLADMKTLQRLNIVNTNVTDLSPLKGLPLQRISLTPGKIESGIEVLRDIPSLNQILTTTVGASNQSAAEFWAKYDAGVYDEKEADSDDGEDAKAAEPTEAAGENDNEDGESPPDESVPDRGTSGGEDDAKPETTEKNAEQKSASAESS